MRKAGLSLLLALAVLSLADRCVAAAGSDSDSFVFPFAMNSNTPFLQGDYAAPLLDTGVSMVRLDAAGFPNTRPTAETDPDHWNWKNLETIRAIQHRSPGLEFELVLGYGTKWAADPSFANVQGSDTAEPQRGIRTLPADSPQNLYGNFVYETVLRNKNICKTWESWNEPDLPGHGFFKGDGHDFFPYQKACYLAAKKADPDCTVLFAGMTFANIEGYLTAHGLPAPTPSPTKVSFFEQYLQECAKDPDAKANHDYFDVMNQHSYSRASDLYDYPAVLQKLMKDYLGEVKPIWITEMGMEDSGSAFGGTRDEYCDYLLQSYAWGSLAGVQRFFHFQLDNSNGLGLYQGMLGKPKPALITYRDLLVKEFSQARFVRQLHGHAGVGFLEGNSPFHPSWQTGYDLFEFQSRDGSRRLYMAFTDTGNSTTIQIPAHSASATLITRHNERSTIQPTAGAYSVTLPGATNNGGWPTINAQGKALGQPEHLVGGATFVLIEQK
jgi:hypothetical protein